MNDQYKQQLAQFIGTFEEFRKNQDERNSNNEAWKIHMYNQLEELSDLIKKGQSHDADRAKHIEDELYNDNGIKVRVKKLEDKQKLITKLAYWALAGMTLLAGWLIEMKDKIIKFFSL